MGKVRRRSRWLLVTAILLLILFLTSPFWMAALGRFLVHAEAAVPAEMIVVLAGGYHGDRILTAASLIRQGIAPQALVSGPADFYGLHETDLAIPFAVHHGYPESYFIALPNDARSTVAEAEVVLAELRRRNVHKIDVVTSNFHTRRSAYIYRARAHGMEIHVVSAPDQYFNADSWWKNRDARKIFVVEWMKTFATWLGM